MFVNVCRVLLIIFAWLSVLRESVAFAQVPRQLVSIEPGDLPIILTAPHGGREVIPNVPPRSGNGVRQFRYKSDDFTEQLTEKLADAIESETGKRPYIVIANFHRKYLDANRRAAEAFESEQARVVYEKYHKAISDARREVTERWGCGVLFDIHGQAAEPQAIFRGTQNGKTVKRLLKRSGDESWRGESSFFGQLAKQGVRVIPAIGSTELEHSSYDGGFTVMQHGSAAGGTVDAIQLELGRQLRMPDKNASTAKKLAIAITAFSAKYLPPTEQAIGDIDERQ